MPDEPSPSPTPDASPERSRRRPLLLAVLATAALFLAVAGSGALAGGGSGSSSGGFDPQPVQATPAAQQQDDGRERGDGRRGDCPRKDGGRSPAADPPV